MYVFPGSIVCTDGWKAYIQACLNLVLQHRFVNHGINFKDPVTGVHTNIIEGVNNGFKTPIALRKYQKKLNDLLWYYIFRIQNKKQLCEGFIKL